MKKGIVMEIHRKYAILLTKNGVFEKGIILTENTEIGDEVIFQPVSNHSMWKKYWRKSSAAVKVSAIILLALSIFGFTLLGGMDDSETEAYVAIDINPSIELELNDDFVVTNVSAVNDSASKLIDEINSSSDKSFYAVLKNIIHQSEDQGLAENKKMIVGVSCKDPNSTPGDIIPKINTYIESLVNWEVITLAIPKEVQELAKNKNKSMNEVMASELKNSNMDIEQVYFNTADIDNREVIQFFYGE